MVVGVLQFELIVHDCASIKDKRRVVKSLKDRLHREHMVSVGEVGAHDMLNLAIVGLACVGTDGRRVGEVLDRVSEKLRAMTDGELGSTRRHILTLDQLEEADPEHSIDDIARELMAHLEDDGGQS